MTDHVSPVSDPLPLGDDLPPVQPPSAGFILQLFVVPALIVLAIVAAWALFGRLAAGEQDWRQLAQEMESPNPHVYRRAMFGMAQLLDTDRRLGDKGQQLAANPEVARALSDLFRKQLDVRQADEETLSSQVYLARALGLLDVPEASIPVLAEALDAGYDIEVRKGAVTSIAMIAGRALERQESLGDNAVDPLILLSQDPDPGLRRAATFALGLTSGEASQSQLLVLLQDPEDWMTQVNAAIALSRRDSVAGFPVFVKALEPEDATATPEAQQDRLLILRNVLKAIGDLAARFTDEQRQELIVLVGALAEDDPETRVRVDAQGALAALEAVK